MEKSNVIQFKLPIREQEPEEDQQLVYICSCGEYQKWELQQEHVHCTNCGNREMIINVFGFRRN